MGDSLRNNCIPEAVPGETFKRGLGVGESVPFHCSISFGYAACGNKFNTAVKHV